MDSESASSAEPVMTDEASRVTGPIARRAFVRTGGGLLAASLFGSACGEDAVGNVIDAGTIRLLVSGHASNIANAGSARLIGTALDATVAVPVSGVIEQAVPIGSYRLVYTPPSGHVLAQGQTTQRDLTVTPGGVVEAAFLIVATNGQIVLNVTGLSSGALSGGSAQVLRTDIGGQAPLTMAVAANGTAQLDVSPGIYDITYTPPSGHQMAAGQSNVRSAVSVAAGQSATLAFGVSVTPTTGTLHIVISGVDAGASGGGSAQILRMDVPNQEPTLRSIPTSGILDVALTAGTYNVTYTPPTGHRIVTGVNPQVATVSVGQTASVAFTVSNAPQSTAGTIRVNVTGLGSATQGGSAIVQRTDTEEAPQAMTIPGSGSAELTVTAGTYRVTYVPPAGYQLTPGQATSQTFGVTAGQTNTIIFSVAAASTQPSTGVARINVTGLAAGASSGGTAQLARTDVSQNPINVNIPASGTVDVTAAVGSYVVTYSQPAGHQLANGQSSQASLNITANQTSTVSFQVQVTQGGGGGSAGAIFFSNWATLGTSQAAKTDGGKWNIISDPGNSLDVIAGGPFGFPSPNCLRVIAKTSAQGFARLAKTGLGVPTVGQSYFYRWYYRHEQPSLNDNSQHPIESGQTGGLDWSFSNETISNTTWRPEFRPGGDQTNAMLARWTGPVLQRSVTYRFELQIHKISNTEMRMHARVYSAGGALIADDDDFTNDRLQHPTRLSLADNPVLHFNTPGGSQLDEVRAGNNGISVGDWGPEMLYAYQGCFAIRNDDWCGPYGTVAGET